MFGATASRQKLPIKVSFSCADRVDETVAVRLA